jgi:hypothetical protein
MKSVKNVVFVDFRRGRGAALRGPGGGAGLGSLVFVAFLVVEILCSAILFPSVIGSAFFGPLAVAVAVAGAMGTRRAIAGWKATKSRRRVGGLSDSGDGHRGRTLH